jgi:hypothetical protein
LCCVIDHSRPALLKVEGSFVKEFSRSSKQGFQIYRPPGSDITCSSNIKMSSLWGKSRVLVLKNIKISNISLGPIADTNGCSSDQVEYWQGVFEDLHSLYEETSSPVAMPEDRIDTVQGNITNLIARIRDMIGPELVTPYMHVMEAHVGEMIRATPFLSMGAFSCQSLELKNSHQSSVLFRQTMKGGGDPRSTQDRTHKILLDIIQLELCLTFSCRDRENV